MIYFDNAATGFPKSGEVVRAVAEAMAVCGNPGRGTHPPAAAAALQIYGCREALAALTGALPENVVLTPNTTLALNMAIKGLIKGGRVIMTPFEHNSVCRPLYALEKEKRITLAIAGFDLSDDETVIHSVLENCRGKTHAVITHASNVCGRIMPVKRIADIIHGHGGYVILDAAQSAGHIPVTFEETGADVICLAGHKGLMGPMGTGALIASPEAASEFSTIIEGGSGVASFMKEMPELLPERLEAGTLNAPAFAGLTAAVSGLKDTAREREIFAYITESMKRMRGVTVYGAPENDLSLYVPVLLFNIKGKSADETASALAGKEICVRSGYHCAPLAHEYLHTKGGVRISVGAANTMEDADGLLSQIEALTPAR